MFFRFRGLWRHSDFVKLWAGQTVSAFGSMLGALSLTALVYLDASPSQLGLLAAAQGLPVLVFALFVGVWTDRLPLRPLLIAADVGRFAVLLTVPAAALLGALRIEQLYIVAFVFGLLELTFEVAYRSYLPRLVEPGQVLEGNAKLSASESVAEIGSPAIGGALVQSTSGPFAVFVDALTFLWSAACLVLIRKNGASREREGGERSALRDALDGVRALWRDRILRALAATSATSRFFGGFWQALYGVFLVRALEFTPLMLGITIGAGGVGALAGAWLVAPMTRRFGVGHTLIVARLVPVGALIPLAGGPVEFAFVMIVVAQLFGDPFWSVYEITSMTVRQSVTPERLLGRVNSGFYLLQAGTLPLGALLAGLLAEQIGARSALWIAVIGGLASAAWLILSPVRSFRDATSAAEHEAVEAGAGSGTDN
jgi:predicted MFS family arabinose efflux permease